MCQQASIAFASAGSQESSSQCWLVCYSLGKICQLTDVLYNPESAWVCLKAGQLPRSPLVNHFVPNQNSEKPVSNSPEYQNVGMLVCWLCIFRYSPYLMFCIPIKFLYVKGQISFPVKQPWRFHGTSTKGSRRWAPRDSYGYCNHIVNA